MALWDTDLTTEDGALGAAQMGAYACFVMAVLGVVGVALTSGIMASSDRVGAIMILVFGLFEILLFLVAGWRLLAGKGAVWGIAAAVMLVIEIIAKLATMAPGIALIINIGALIAVINGIRGARALKSGQFDAEETAEIFS